jgi:DNA-binding MarR family transcriptional regulator
VHTHEQYEHQILTAIDGGQSLSQRSLANSLGIALGLTNLLVRRLVRKGWVRISRIRPNRVRYFLTPAGVAEKARLSRLYLQNAITFYVRARDRIRESLGNAGGPSTRIVFYGTGEIAEIAYVCLQETALELVGVVEVAGQRKGRQFFGVPVYSFDGVHDGLLNGTAFDRLVVTSFANHEAIRTRLEASGVTPERVLWL